MVNEHESKNLERSNRDNAEGLKFIQLVMHGANYRLAHNPTRAQGTRGSNRATEIDPLGSSAMLDLIYISLTVAFFLIAIAYVRMCERLQ